MHIMNRNALAMLWKLLDSLLLSVMLLVGAKLTSAFSSFEVVFLVNLLAALIAFLLFAIAGTVPIRPRRPKLHFYRGALGVASTACFLLSLKHLGLAESTAISFLAPIITTLISKYRLKEAVDTMTAVILVLNFLAVVLVLYGRFEMHMTDGTVVSIGFSIASMACMVLYNLNLKNIGKEDTVAAQSIFGPLFSALLLAPLIAPRISSMTTRLDVQYGFLVMLYASLLILKSSARYFSFKLGDLSKMMPMDYMQILFTAVLATIFLDQKIAILAAIGIGMIFLTGTLQIYIAARSPESSYS